MAQIHACGINRKFDAVHNKNERLKACNIQEKIFLPERLPGLQPGGNYPIVLKRSVAPPFDVKGFQPLL